MRGIVCPRNFPSFLFSVEREHSSEPCLPVFQVLHGICHLVERELLDHDLDTLVLGEVDGLLAVEGVTRGPSVY